MLIFFYIISYIINSSNEIKIHDSKLGSVKLRFSEWTHAMLVSRGCWTKKAIEFSTLKSSSYENSYNGSLL